MLRQMVCWLWHSNCLKPQLLKWWFSKPLFSSVLELDLPLSALALHLTAVFRGEEKGDLLLWYLPIFLLLRFPLRWEMTANVLTKWCHLYRPLEALCRRHAGSHLCLNSWHCFPPLPYLCLLFSSACSKEPQPCSLCGYNNSYSTPELDTA